MRATIRRALLPIILLLLALGIAVPNGIRAQDAIPTEQQLQIWKNLSQEQQDAILKQITSGGTVGGAPVSRDTSGRDTPERRVGDTEPTPPGETAADGARREGQEPTTNVRRVPVLTGDDSVIVRIDLKRPPDAQLPVVPQTPQVPGQGNPTIPPPSSVPQRVVELSQEEKDRREALVNLIRSGNPYRLTREGLLNLPGFSGIPLAGLSDFQATVRLQAEPALRDFDVGLIRLPLTKIGSEALKPFGYDLFDRAPSTFAPVTNVPVPADYVVGPGDQFQVQLYGNQNRSFALNVGRDGRVNFPELGPIVVGGSLFSAVKTQIESRVERQMIGVRASVSMGDTRSIRVFVLGEAKRPGSYSISGLGTMTSALFAAGGVRPIGSLRNIQLKRQGAVIRTLDLYDMLIRGDTTDDAKLLPGDVVFVPPLGSTVSVDGEVRRPAIYEVKGESKPADVVALAGDLTPEADTSRVSIIRINADRSRTVVNVNLAAPAAKDSVRNGDLLRVSRLRPTLDSGVSIDGFVFSPATYEFREGMHLSDVLRSVDDLKPDADIHYLLIRRELPPDRTVVAVSADLDAALRKPGSEADVLLMPRDRITVFDLKSGRDRIIRPLLDELKRQSNVARPTEIVTIEGKVNVPGQYPLEPGMTVRDLLRAGGNLSDAAYSRSAELTRYRSVNGDNRRTEQIQIDLDAVLRGDPAANIVLQPSDSLSVKELPEWGDKEHITLVGELRFPGRYSIKRGETLRSVIARAGGLTELAFPEGSIFTRDELKAREQKQLDVLGKRLQNDLVTLALQGAAASNQAQAGTALSIGQSLLSQLRASEAVGRLVIDLPRVLRASGGTGDIIVRDGDRLMVPKFQQEVTVIGEVQTETSHVYRPELSRDDYIALSGGLTRRADIKKIYVVRADGSVLAHQDARWFSRSSIDIRPGDTIVAPLDTERVPALPFWQAVTSIVYNLAISAAAVNSF